MQEDHIRSLAGKYSEYSSEELSGIILNYINYTPDAAEAALYMAVEKGMIGFDLKEALLEQIRRNFALLEKRAKIYFWEGDNAFTAMFSGYSDDQLYELIEDPPEMTIDVYHAILKVARERELLSESDFTEFYRNAKGGNITRNQLREFNPLGVQDDDSEEGKEPVEKRPKPSNSRWSVRNASPFMQGIYLILAGIGIAALQYIRPFIGFHRHPNIIGYFVAGASVLIGIFIAVSSLFSPRE
jgi:hypothetical protein